MYHTAVALNAKNPKDRRQVVNRSANMILRNARQPNRAMLDECDLSTDFDLFLLPRPAGDLSAVRRSR
jgi:hypothetical protein